MSAHPRLHLATATAAAGALVATTPAATAAPLTKKVRVVGMDSFNWARVIDDLKID